MAVFAGEFALILLMSGEREKLSEITRRSVELGSLTGLTIWVKEPSRKKPAEPALPYQLIASCMDHPGVVYRLTNTLSAFGVNIESMETQTQAAPVTGTNIFRMEAVITVPAGVNVNALRGALNEIEREENIDISFGLVSSSPSGH
jgi:glycine cleavage system transcriptional repressor